MTVLTERILRQCVNIHDTIRKAGPAPATDSFGTRWNNPDNIAFGQLGSLYFMVTLWRHTNDGALWAEIMARLQQLEQHCAVHKTNNFSLYTGRLGVARLYLQLYYQTKQQQYLLKAVKLCYTYFDDRPDQLKFFDNCSLLDGFAGIALFCTQLYRETKQDWLMDAIKKCVHVLIDRSEMNGKGMYWNGLTNATHRQMGWGYGCSGTAMVFLELAALFDSKYFMDLAALAFKYEDEHLPAPEGFSMLHGRTGIDLVRLYAGLLGRQEAYIDRWAHTAAAIMHHAHRADIHTLPMHGMALRQAYLLTGNMQYHQDAEGIAATLLQRLEAGGQVPGNGAGLLGSSAGIGYFLLGMLDTAHPLVLPGMNTLSPVSVITGRGDAALIESMQLSGISKYIVQKNFKKSYPIVQREFAKEVAAFLSRKQCTVEDFSMMVRQLNKERLTSDQWDELHDVFEKEFFAVRLKQQVDETNFPDEKSYLEKVHGILRLSNEELLDLELEMSGNVWFISLEDAIDMSRPLDHKILEDVIFKYGSKSYYMRVNRFNELEISSAYSMKIVLDLFKEPASVRWVLDTLLEFFSSQSHDILRELKAGFEVDSDEALWEELRTTVMDKVRFLLLSDVLLLPEQALNKNNMAVADHHTFFDSTS